MRVPANGRERSQWIAKQVLDQGVFGIIFPMINTPEDAVAALRACRYAQALGAPDREPVGQRGHSPAGAARYWGLSLLDYTDQADVWPLDPAGEILLCLQCEHIDAVDNLEQILDSVENKPGVILISEKDLSVSMGYRSLFTPEVAQIEALPDGPVALSAPGIEVGHHSIEWWSHSYDNPLVNGPPGDGVKDPVQTIFFNVGSAWDVQFDLQNWTSRQWRLTDCGGTQYMYIFDADHDGGYDGWRVQDYQLEPEDSTNLCGQPRDHVWLFQSLVEDSHGEYGIWSGGTPHHDNTGHGCPDDWDGPRARVRDSFRDPSTGAPLWFVTDVWEEYFGPEGQNQCDYWEGFVTFINLNQ